MTDIQCFVAVLKEHATLTFKSPQIAPKSDIISSHTYIFYECYAPISKTYILSDYGRCSCLPNARGITR